MRICLKYCMVMFIVGGCKGSSRQVIEESQFSKAEPLTVALNVTEGYRTNQLTGDTIKALLNSFGDTIQTGVPVRFNGTMKDSNMALLPKVIKAGSPAVLTGAGNVHPVPDLLEIIPVDTSRLKKVKLGEGVRSQILRNSQGIIPTGVPIAAAGITMPFSEPHPVYALPLRFKDAAIANVQYLDVEQGMSCSFVYALLEDKRGNLWFGMDATGLTKYDGVSFTHYTAREGLVNNTVTVLMEDKKGNLWIGTYKGISVFDGKNFTNFNEESGLSNNYIKSIIEDRAGNVWISSLQGLSKYDGKSFTHYSRKEGLPADTILTCVEDRKGNLWIGTNYGVAKFDGTGFTHYTQKDGLTTNSIFSVIEDRKGNIWLGAGNGGINKFDGKSFTHYTEKQGLSANGVWSLLEDSKGNIWAGTTFGGINKFDGKMFTHYNQAEGLSNNKVRQIIEDSNGCIWFGTDGGGVNKLNDAGLSYLEGNEVLANNRIRPLLKDKNGNIWFGTEGAGFGKYDAAKFAGETTKLTYHTTKDGIKHIGQRSLLEDKNGNIWIGTAEGGLSKYDGKNFTSYSVREGLSGASVFSMLEDKRGNLWLGTGDDGITMFDGKNFTQYGEKEGLPAKRIFSILEDRNKNLWFGTEVSGVCKYDGASITNYTEREGLLSSSVTSIIEDKNGYLWLGTQGAGVCRFDGKNFTYYTEREGLSNNNVWSIIEDADRHIWVGTDKGLNLFIPDTSSKKTSDHQYVIYKFGLQDGLKAIDFNLHSVCIDNSNHIWWGTGKNVVTFDLNKPFQAYPVRSLKLNYIEVNERFYDYRNLSDSVKEKITFNHVVPFSNYPEAVKLAYNQNHITFHFSAIDWSAPDKIKYSYRLKGLDEGWSAASEKTFADYRNLNYGRYELQIKAIGQSQVWTEPFTYSFTIYPAWWQTWWFKTLVTIAALAIVFFIGRLIYFYQLRKQKSVMEKKLAVQYERQRISAEMHDDIGAGLSGIRLLTEMTKNKVKDKQAAEEVEKIYQSVGDISSKMKEVIWSLNTENDELASLISFIQKQVRQWLEHYPCQLRTKIPDLIPGLQVSGEARRNIFLLVKEAIHNIIKHAEASKVSVTIDYNDNQLSITVSDNGKGISSNQNNSGGNGMKNMRQRMEKLNGRLFIKNNDGLTLTFEIPLQATI